MDDAAIHRVLNHADGNGDWLLCSIHSSPFHLHSSICCFPVDRHARKGLAMTTGRVRFVYSGPVDRHGLRPRDDKSRKD
jgi:hypothetical protein